MRAQSGIDGRLQGVTVRDIARELYLREELIDVEISREGRFQRRTSTDIVKRLTLVYNYDALLADFRDDVYESSRRRPPNGPIRHWEPGDMVMTVWVTKGQQDDATCASPAVRPDF